MLISKAVKKGVFFLNTNFISPDHKVEFECLLDTSCDFCSCVEISGCYWKKLLLLNVFFTSFRHGEDEVLRAILFVMNVL